MVWLGPSLTLLASPQATSQGLRFGTEGHFGALPLGYGSLAAWLQTVSVHAAPWWVCGGSGGFPGWRQHLCGTQLDPPVTINPLDSWGHRAGMFNNRDDLKKYILPEPRPCKVDFLILILPSGLLSQLPPPRPAECPGFPRPAPHQLLAHGAGVSFPVPARV